MKIQSKKFYEKLSKFKEKKKGLLHLFLVKKFTCMNKQILDLGCGKGELAYFFAQMDNKIRAIDVSKPMLNYAMSVNKHKNITYLLQDIRSLKLKKKFDVIFAINSLVHIKSLGHLLRQIYSLLKKDGKFILCFPHPTQDLKEIKDYLKEQLIRTRTKFGIVEQYYRPIQFYLNLLIEERFAINKIYEFKLKKEKIPFFFIVELKKKLK
ncbi:MAG: class I SAM-dependent methyltransferase [Candidatus Pacearchaeota archaeon]|nr:MAG: class I SAM-dependent methyltransferase [Candidatus Pacearchaeota archaeon]